MADKIVIRPVGTDERAAWEPLWDGYIAFYKATLEPGASDVAWQRFHDPDEPMFLLGAYVDGKLTGIVQYLFHRSTWTPGNYCYLQYPFVKLFNIFKWFGFSVSHKSHRIPIDTAERRNCFKSFYISMGCELRRSERAKSY